MKCDAYLPVNMLTCKIQSVSELIQSEIVAVFCTL